MTVIAHNVLILSLVVVCPALVWRFQCRPELVIVDLVPE